MMKFILAFLVPFLFMTAAFAMIGASSALDHSATHTNVAEIWKSECASCHGPDGRGQTRAGQRAGVKDFTDVGYQGSWTDAEALQVIKTAKKDGKALRNKNPYADQLTEQEIGALVTFVRAFAAGV
jgi:cytochrome c6